MLRIIRNLIAIVPVENPDMIGSIIIPDIAKDRLNQGFVKYRGPDTKDCKIGDYVLFSGYTGTLTYIEGEGKIIIMPEDFVVATIERIPEVEISGVYFRDRVDEVTNTQELYAILREIMPDLDVPSTVTLAEQLAKRNVIAPSANPYFPGTYETIMGHIAAAFSANKEWRDRLVVREMERLKDEEFDKTRPVMGVKSHIVRPQYG